VLVLVPRSRCGGCGAGIGRLMARHLACAAPRPEELLALFHRAEAGDHRAQMAGETGQQHGELPRRTPRRPEPLRDAHAAPPYSVGRLTRRSRLASAPTAQRPSRRAAFSRSSRGRTSSDAGHRLAQHLALFRSTKSIPRSYEAGLSVRGTSHRDSHACSIRRAASAITTNQPPPEIGSRSPTSSLADQYRSPERLGSMPAASRRGLRILAGSRPHLTTIEPSTAS